MNRDTQFSVFKNRLSTNFEFRNFFSKMPPIQEHGYEGDYGYDDADWDGGRPWGRQDGWDVHQRRRQEQMYDRRQPQEIGARQQHNQAGYVAAAASHNGVYDRYDNAAAAAAAAVAAPSRISYAGRTVGPAAAGVLPAAPDWPPSRHISSHAAAAGVAGITTPPRHLRKLPQIPKPAEITQKLQQQKQLMANNIR